MAEVKEKVENFKFYVELLHHKPIFCLLYYMTEASGGEFNSHLSVICF